MPYKVSWEPLGITRFSGVVSDDELIAANAEVNASPLLAAMKYMILDFSMIEKFDVSTATVRALADSDRRAAAINPDVRIAIITSSPLMRGMSNMYAIAQGAGEGGTSWTTQLFEREEDARAWAVPSG